MVEDLIKRLRNWRDTHLSGLAREAADLIEQQSARIAELEAAIRKQANAARCLADATIRDATIRQGLAEKAYAESSPEVLASERQANAMLTEENERLTSRLTALESERDALLAAAGKEAVAYTTADRLKRIAERNRHVDTMWPASMSDKGDIPLFTAPQAQTALTDDVLMQAIADTAARGHVWASRALSNFRAVVRQAAKSPDDA